MKKLIINLFALLLCAQLYAQVSQTTNSLCTVAERCSTAAKSFKLYLVNGKGGIKTSSELVEQVRNQLPGIKTQVDSNLYARIVDFVKMHQEGVESIGNITKNPMGANLWATIFETKAKYIKEHLCTK